MVRRENIWIISAEYYKDYKIKIIFNDGLEGTVDLEKDLNQPVFQPLKDLKSFRNFKLNGWTIEWQNGADFAPEFLYHQITENLLVK